MRYVDFEGNKISKLSLGAVQFGLDYGIANNQGKPTQIVVNQIIDYVHKKGINCFDTAQAYGDSEKVLARASSDLDVVIISKLKSELFKNNIEKNISKSLSNLNQKTIFALLLHDSELLYSWEDRYTKTVKNLKKNNQIKYFGVSIYTSKEFDLAISNNNIKIIQIPFNIFDQRALKYSWFEKAKRANKLLFIRSIFLQGLFFLEEDKLKSDLKDAVPFIIKLHNISAKLNLSVADLAMAYVESVVKDSVILFGCETLNQAKENIEIFDNIKYLSKNEIDNIFDSFKDIPEYIYNPSKWSR